MGNIGHWPDLFLRFGVVYFPFVLLAAQPANACSARTTVQSDPTVLMAIRCRVVKSTVAHSLKHASGQHNSDLGWAIRVDI